MDPNYSVMPNQSPRLDIDKLSAMMNAAKISPHVQEVTIGPKCKLKTIVISEEVENESENLKPTKCDDRIEDISRKEVEYLAKKRHREVREQDNADKVLRDLLEKMMKKRAESKNLYLQKQYNEYEKKRLELKRRKLQLLKESESSYLLTHKQISKNSITQDNISEILAGENDGALRMAALTRSQTIIVDKYNEIVSLLQSNDDVVKIICEQHISSLNEIIGKLNSLLPLSKGGMVSERDVAQSEFLVKNIENLEIKIKQEIQTAMDQAKQKKLDEKIKREEIAKKIELEEKRQNEINQIKNNVPIKPQFYSNHNFEHYKQLQTFLSQYESLSKEFRSNPSLKKFCFDCQKAVNTPINAISSVNGSHMRDKFEKLSKLLKGERVQVLDTFVSASQHPQGVAFCSALLAKKILKQCDSQISSNTEAAFPLASVTVALWTLFPDLGRLIEANFHRECPYIVPMFLPQQEGQSDEEFYRSRGYKYIDGAVEKHDKFLKRMSGIFTLQCAIWITSPSNTVKLPNPHGIQNAWRWLASFINLRPEPDISATLLFTFFSICGSECSKYYGKQFSKIVKVVCTDYMKILDNIDEGGPKTRLEVFLQNIFKKGHIPPPKGTIAPNTW